MAKKFREKLRKLNPFTRPATLEELPKPLPANPDQRLVKVYVEGYEDVAFWRGIFDHFQNPYLRFEISVPDRGDLPKGKKVLKVGKYEKFAKTMLNPSANDGLYKKVLGHDLEIVLLTNPADIKAGDDIKAEVLLNGTPVKAPLGLTYDGYSAEQDAYMAKAETGADGMASFKVTKPGLWMLRTEVTEKLTDGSADKRNMRATYVFPVMK